MQSLYWTVANRAAYEDAMRLVDATKAELLKENARLRAELQRMRHKK